LSSIDTVSLFNFIRNLFRFSKKHFQLQKKN